MKNWLRIHEDPSLLQPFLVREKVIDAMRAFMKQNKFLEVETPKLLPQPSTEPFLEVFDTQLKMENEKPFHAFLPTSPEFALKKLLAAGVGNCFELCKSFRNGEGRSSKHNPEFTILEFYHVNADYFDVMRDVEQMFQAIFRAVYPQKKDYLLPYQGGLLDLNAPWERITVSQAFEKYSGIDQDTLLDEQKLLNAGAQKGYKIETRETSENPTTWEQIYNQILFNEIEPHLGKTKPTFLYEYPASQAAFSRRKADDPRFAERFEVFLAGYELGNCFSELVDPVEQRKRCEEDLATRKSLGKTTFGMDEDFIHALELGFPPTSGIAMGVDRIAALFADTPRIQDVIFFPVDDLFPPSLS